MPKHYDVFVIGGGPAGQHLANRCKSAGLSVGITECRGYGGTCGLRGCDPKRVMVGVTETVDMTYRLEELGVCGHASVNWSDLTDFVATFVDDKPARALAVLREAGIDAYTGQARFTGPRAVRVEGRADYDDAEGPETVDVTADHIVVATGQRPRPLDIPGAEHLKTSDDFHLLPALPPRILFAGGGYIALESAHIARRCGAEITIVNDDDNPLAVFDDDLAARLVELTGDLGIDFVMNTRVTGVEALDGGGFRVSAETDGGEERSYEVDLVLNTSGRVANFAGLDLDAAGIEASGAGIPVDEHFRTRANAHVYAIGDCADGGGPPLTPVANHDADTLATTLTTGEPATPDYDGLPTAVYTLPELAMVGLTEREARERDLDVEVTVDLDHDEAYHARRVNARAYAHKTLVDRATGKIVGAHLLGPRASEVINLFALAMRTGIPASELHEVLWAYPTWGGDVGKMIP